MVHVGDVAGLVARIAASPVDVVAIVSDGRRYCARDIQERVAPEGTRPRVTIPRWAVQVAGRTGSALQVASHRSLPFTRADVDRLLADALYEQHAPLPVEWAPTTDLYRSMGLA
jgi:hypothetical protein